MELGGSQILHARGALGIKPSGSLVVFNPKCLGEGGSEMEEYICIL